MQTAASNQSCDEVSQVSAAQRRSSAPKQAVLSPSAKSWKAFAFGYCIAMVVANLYYLPSFANPEIPYCSTTEVQQLMHKDDSPKPVPMTAFEKIVQFAYNHTYQDIPTFTPKTFDVQTWEHKSSGGLKDADRIMLARIYGEAESVMEYGLGESTLIAGHVGVQRYAGIDSDPSWISQSRDVAPPHFRFYLADVGKTGNWGHPIKTLTKAVLNYQLVPLIVEPQPFDVYMVDGRFRFPCLMASFLHASAKGEKNLTKTIVLVHDCTRRAYIKANHLFDVEFSGKQLCAYRRRPNTTDEQLVDYWKQAFSQVA